MRETEGLRRGQHFPMHVESDMGVVKLEIAYLPVEIQQHRRNHRLVLCAENLYDTSPILNMFCEMASWMYAQLRCRTRLNLASFMSCSIVLSLGISSLSWYVLLDF